MAGRNVTPDDTLLTQIFPTDRPETTSVFLQNWDKCVFKAEFPGDLEAGQTACVVRLEAENENLDSFATVAAMQQLASTVIPELVPRTLQVGKARNAQGRSFDFSVVEFVEGDLLEDVWQQMSAEEQSFVAVELVEALEKLHSVRLSDKATQKILNQALQEGVDMAWNTFEQPGTFGGAHTGLLKNGAALLDSIMEMRQLNKPFCTVEPIVESQCIRIQSNFEELGSIILDSFDVDKWPGEAVLCHNDPNPRNLILQRSAPSGGKSKYKLAGIIDWELAGFYPPSYELSLQDTYLSGGNRHVSFYLLLKDYMKRLVPRSSSQIGLLRAMELIFESQQRVLSDGTNIPAHIRKRFLERSKLTRDTDPYVGWTRNPHDVPFFEYSRADLQKLEDEVVQEMVAKRKSMANRQ